MITNKSMTKIVIDKNHGDSELKHRRPAKANSTKTRAIVVDVIRRQENQK
jgi:hypothetical protein